MAGFDNDIVYADNLDFSGGAVPAAQMVADGQLLIGATGANPGVATLASADGSTTITDGAGTIDLASVGLDQNNTLYVGKHGNDANDGLTINKAFLTFGAAITAAGANTAIVCFDAGTYTENLTLVADVCIHAANASLIGNHVLVDDSRLEFRQYTTPTTATGFSKTAGAGAAHVIGQEWDVIAGVTTVGFLCTSGRIFGDMGHIEIGAGSFLIGSATTDEMYLRFEEIDITDAATVFASGAAGDINAIGECIEDDGSGTLFFGTPGATANIAVVCSKVDIENLSNINANIDAELTVSHLTGTQTEAGAGNALIGGATRIDNVPIGGVIPSTSVFTTCDATTFDTNVAAAAVTLTGTTLEADGTDANIPITLTPKGTEAVTIDGLDYPMADGNAGECMVTSGAGVLSLGVLTVPGGGTGIATQTAYSVLCGGTTATGNMQSLAAIGAAGEVLTSAGAGALPSWQAAAGGGFDIYPTGTVIGTSWPSVCYVAFSSTNSFSIGNADEVYCIPFTCSAEVTVAQLGVYCTTSNAGAVLRWGLYTDVNGIPDTRFFESGEINCTAAGFKWVTDTITVPTGVVWVLYVRDIAGISVRRTTSSRAIGYDTGTAATGYDGFRQTYTYAQLPATFTLGTPTLSSAQGGPMILYQMT